MQGELVVSFKQVFSSQSKNTNTLKGGEGKNGKISCGLRVS